MLSVGSAPAERSSRLCGAWAGQAGGRRRRSSRLTGRATGGAVVVAPFERLALDGGGEGMSSGIALQRSLPAAIRPATLSGRPRKAAMWRAARRSQTGQVGTRVERARRCGLCRAGEVERRFSEDVVGDVGIGTGGEQQKDGFVDWRARLSERSAPPGEGVETSAGCDAARHGIGLTRSRGEGSETAVGIGGGVDGRAGGAEGADAAPCPASRPEQRAVAVKARRSVSAPASSTAREVDIAVTRRPLQRVYCRGSRTGAIGLGAGGEERRGRGRRARR